MPITRMDLRAALEGLPTERLTRLVDGLENTPAPKLTVASWRPLCPMLLAGFDPEAGAADAPERRFADVWDYLAGARPRGHWLPRLPGTRLVARRRDVQLLLRTASAVLAARSYEQTSSTTARRELGDRSSLRDARETIRAAQGNAAGPERTAVHPCPDR